MSDVDGFKPTHFHASGDRYECIGDGAFKVMNADLADYAEVGEDDVLVVYRNPEGRMFVTTPERWAARFTAIPPRVVAGVHIEMETVVKMRDVMMQAGGGLQTFPDGFLLDTAQAMEDVLKSTQGLLMSAIQRMQWTRFVALCRAADAMRVAAKQCDSAFLLHDPQSVNT